MFLQQIIRCLISKVFLAFTTFFFPAKYYLWLLIKAL